MHSDRDSIDGALRGDVHAFRAIVQRYETMVLRVARGMLGAVPEAEDVAQDTFIRLYRSLGTFREEAHLRTFVYRIAINLSLNAVKRRQRRRLRFIALDRAADALPSVPAGSDLEDRERSALVRHAIDTLSPKLKAVLVLRLIEGLAIREIAETLDLPQGTVLSRLARGQEKLRKHLEPILRSHEA